MRFCGDGVRDAIQLIGGSMFIDNKYRKWYMALMARAEDRVLTCYFERHHVLPKSLGGPDSCRVALTYREHYIAHWMLTKFSGGQAKKKMCHALWSLTRSRDGKKKILTSAQYERARAAHRESLVGNKFAEGRKKTEEERAAMSAARIGRKFTEEHKAKIGAANKGNKGSRGMKLSEETRAKMRKPKSAEHRANMSASLIGNRRAAGYKRSHESIAKMVSTKAAR